MKYLHMTKPELEKLRPEIAVLPIGSFEQHGPHLPIGTDNYQIEAVADIVARELGAFLLPVQPLTTCYEHHGKRGSVHFTADVFYKVLVGLVERLYRNGFRKVAILCGHGGIFVLGPAIRHLNYTYKDLMVVSPEGMGIGKDDIHAGESETSTMLFLYPELVNMEKALDCIPEKPRPYLNYGSFFTHSPEGVWGRATLGTAEKGKEKMEKSTKALILEIKRLFAEMEGCDYAGKPLEKGEK